MPESISKDISDEQYNTMERIVELLAKDVIEGCILLIKAMDPEMNEQLSIRKALMGAVFARALNKLRDMDPK